MRLSRRDLVPVLTIVAGGVIGASLSFSLLSRSDDVPAPEVVVAGALTLEDRFEVEIESLQNRQRTAVEEVEAYSLPLYNFLADAYPRLRLAEGDIRVVRIPDSEARRLLALERARGLVRSEERGSRPRP